MSELLEINEQQMMDEILSTPLAKSAISQKDEESKTKLEKKIEKKILKENSQRRDNVLLDGALYGLPISFKSQDALRRLQSLEKTSEKKNDFMPSSS